MTISTLIENLGVSLLTAAFIAGLALSWKAIRTALLYVRHEVELDYDKRWRDCSWDIQWEGYRITLATDEVSNDKVDRLVVQVNDGPSETFAPLQTSDSFETLKRSQVQMKLNSIIRTKTSEDDRRYRLFFVFRRRRGFLARL